MPRPKRDEQFPAGEVCVAHVVQRCVRRAFLAGVDPATGRDYSSRKEWIRRRLEALASVFGIDMLGYAIMSNHLHVIVRIRPDVVAQWSDEEVAMRWLRIYPGRRIEEHLAEPNEQDVATLVRDQERMVVIRKRLGSLSWLMRSLAEPIARMANKQDGCTGRFWQGRFQGQKLADDAGLLACAMYVDLNPVRAAIAEEPGTTPFTSVYDRSEAAKGEEMPSAAFDLVPVATEEASRQQRETPVEELRRQRRTRERNPTGKRIRRDGWLAPLTLDAERLSDDAQVHREGVRASDRGFLPMSLEDYLRLLHWTAQQRGPAAAQCVPKSIECSLTSLGIKTSMWRDLVWNWKRFFGRSTYVGRSEAMRADAARWGRRWHHGQRAATACFSS